MTSPSHHPHVRFSDNLSDEQRTSIVDFEEMLMRGSRKFGRQTTARLELQEVDVFERLEDGKTHARVVFEVDVDEGASPAVSKSLIRKPANAYMPIPTDMLNAGQTLHGGCTMHLIDV